MANDQADTLETALKIANQQAAQAANPQTANSGSSNSPAAATPQDAGNGGGSFNIPTPCQDLTGQYGCQINGSIPSLNSGQTQPFNTPRPWVPGHAAPDVQAEIMALANAMLAANVATNQTRVRRALLRHVVNNRLPLKSMDLVCLQQPTGSSGKVIDIPLRWKPEDIKKDAIDRSHLCDDVAEDDAKDACREQKYGQAVMWAEPELAGQCRGAGDIDAVAECAKQKFLNAWNKDYGIVSAEAPKGWTVPSSCKTPMVVAAKRDYSLRERLRAALESARPYRDVGNESELQPQEPVASLADNPAPPAPPPPAIDDDEAYCNYMAREVVRGELTPSSVTAIPPGCKATIAAAEALKNRQNRLFTMDAAETDAAIRHLMGDAGR